MLKVHQQPDIINERNGTWSTHSSFDTILGNSSTQSKQSTKKDTPKKKKGTNILNVKAANGKLKSLSLSLCSFINTQILKWPFISPNESFKNINPENLVIMKLKSKKKKKSCLDAGKEIIKENRL